MNKFNELHDKIMSDLSNISIEIESTRARNIDLLEANRELIKENSILKQECQNALNEVNKCLLIIDGAEKNG